MAISKRAFGADMNQNVKDKLRKRQLASQTINPNEQVIKSGAATGITSDFESKNSTGSTNKGSYADLSSRTPFVRMWTAVSFYEKLENVDTADWEEVRIDDPEWLRERIWAGGYFDNIDSNTKIYNEILKKSALDGDEKSQKLLDEIKVAFEEDIDALKSQGHVPPDVVRVDEETYKYRPATQQRLDRHIYTIGNHKLNELSAVVNGPIAKKTAVATTTTGVVVDEVFQTEQVAGGIGSTGEIPNEFLKPAAGIISVTSGTEGFLGVIKRTTVNFKVNNFHDFQNIYQKYLMRPGAQIFVDFGWSSAGLYNQEDLIDSENPEQFLYCEANLDSDCPKDKDDNNLNGWLTENAGDTETILGVVSGFNSDIQSDGSVTCQVTLTSKNSALMGAGFDKKTNSFAKRALYALHVSSMHKSIVAYLRSLGHTEEELLLWDPNTSTLSADDVETWSTNLQSFMRGLTVTNESTMTPGIPAQKLGYFGRPGKKNFFVNWGRFEDSILNRELAHGLTEKGKFSIKFDSSQSFTTWEPFYKQAMTLNNVDEDFDFMYPDTWDDTFSLTREMSPANTPDKHYIGKEDSETYTKYDKDRYRIPIREMFININVIEKALKTGLSGGSVYDIMKELFKDLREFTQGVFRWSLFSGGDDTKLQVIDLNNLSLATEDQKSDLVFKDLFIFDITSNKSIVKNYTINFNLGDGDIGNMMAIRGMDSGDKIFPDGSVLAELLDLAAADEFDTDASFPYFLKYEPDLGSYRIKTDEKNNDVTKYYKDSFGISQEIIKEDERMTNSPSWSSYDTDDIEYKSARSKAEAVYNQIKELPSYTNAAGTDPDVTSGDEAVVLTMTEDIPSLVSQEESIYETSGITSHNSLYEYFISSANSAFYSKRNPTILPITLNLTIYGEAAIRPGDVFRVNYLPKIYQNYVYFQVIRVTHNIGPAGWETTLETQWRLRPKEKITTVKGNLQGSYGLNNMNVGRMYEPPGSVLSLSYFNKLFKSSDVIKIPMKHKDLKNGYCMSEWTDNTKKDRKSYGIMYDWNDIYVDYFDNDNLACQGLHGTCGCYSLGGHFSNIGNLLAVMTAGQIKPEPDLLEKNTDWARGIYSFTGGFKTRDYAENSNGMGYPIKAPYAIVTGDKQIWLTGKQTATVKQAHMSGTAYNDYQQPLRQSDESHMSYSGGWISALCGGTNTTGFGISANSADRMGGDMDNTWKKWWRLTLWPYCSQDNSTMTTEHERQAGGSESVRFGAITSSYTKYDKKIISPGLHKFAFEDGDEIALGSGSLYNNPGPAGGDPGYGHSNWYWLDEWYGWREKNAITLDHPVIEIIADIATTRIMYGKKYYLMIHNDGYPNWWVIARADQYSNYEDIAKIGRYLKGKINATDKSISTEALATGFMGSTGDCPFDYCEPSFEGNSEIGIFQPHLDDYWIP
jgi:hypothetical protein